MDDVRITVGGTALDCMSTRSLTARVRAQLDGRGSPRPLVLASSNLDHVFQFGHGRPHPDPARGRDADWLVTADGMPVVWAAQWLTRQRWEQLAGSDLLPDLLDVAERRGASVGFVGGWPEQHRRLEQILRTRYPLLRVSGFWGPTRRELDDDQLARALADDVASRATDLLVVGLGKPRQELWLADHVGGTGAAVALAFGGAADFLAGVTNRAPPLMRRLGLEWLFRLWHEPRRLWRRYLLEAPVAILLVLSRSSGRPRPPAPPLPD